MASMSGDVQASVTMAMGFSLPTWPAGNGDGLTLTDATYTLDVHGAELIRDDVVLLIELGQFDVGHGVAAAFELQHDLT